MFKLIVFIVSKISSYIGLCQFVTNAIFEFSSIIGSLLKCSSFILNRIVKGFLLYKQIWTHYIYDYMWVLYANNSSVWNLYINVLVKCGNINSNFDKKDTLKSY